MNPEETEESRFRKAIRIIKDGGLVIAPTETFYGILADALSRKAVTRLLKLKKRGYGKPIPLVAGSIRIAKTMADDPPDIFDLLAGRFWPGPLTIVVKAAEGIPYGITAGTGSIGIRIPGPSPALDLARLHRGILTATSANFPGRPAPRSTGDLDGELAREVDMIIDGGRTAADQPSTVLNLIPDPPAIIRKGVLGEQVESFLAELPRGMNR